MRWSVHWKTNANSPQTLWSAYPFGDTREPFGVYKVIYGIQRLVDYSLDVFWPWYQQAVLQ